MPKTPIPAAAEGLPKLKAMTARQRMDYHAKGYKEAAMEIDPTVTEWWQGEGVEDRAIGRFMLIGSRKEGV